MRRLPIAIYFLFAAWVWGGLWFFQRGDFLGALGMFVSLGTLTFAFVKGALSAKF